MSASSQSMTFPAMSAVGSTPPLVSGSATAVAARAHLAGTVTSDPLQMVPVAKHPTRSRLQAGSAACGSAWARLVQPLAQNPLCATGAEGCWDSFVAPPNSDAVVVHPDAMLYFTRPRNDSVIFVQMSDTVDELNAGYASESSGSAPGGV